MVRTAVLEIYEEVRREGARADQALQRVLRREKQLRSVERRAVSDAVYGLLRLQGRVDHLLGYAAYLVVGEGQSPESAAGLAGPEVAPWTWALALLAQPGALGAPDDPLDALAAETSLPRWLAQLWSSQLGADETRKLAAALNQRAPLTVRTNLLKNTRDELLATLRAEGSRVEPTRLSPWGVTFTGRTNVFALKAFKAGLFEVQDEGSQLIALACEARPGQVVVDACAGAGGKALALAGEMHNKGRLIACDRACTTGKRAPCRNRTTRGSRISPGRPTWCWSTRPAAVSARCGGIPTRAGVSTQPKSPRFRRDRSKSWRDIHVW